MIRDVYEMEKFWKVLDSLGRNEVYVLLLVGVRNGERKIFDTVLIKSNDFSDFFNKVSLLLNKAKRLPFETEILLDINKKNVVSGLQNGFKELNEMIENGEDVRNFFSILLKKIRYSPVTDYVMVKSKDPLIELNPEYVVKCGETYYNVLSEYVEGSIKKPEIPIPGTIFRGKIVSLYYVSQTKRSMKRS